MSDPTLYEKYGGFSTIGNIVHSFYEKLTDEECLDPYFQGIDMDRLARHQTDFLCMVMGGPATYTGRSLREAHLHLHIQREHFLLVSELLEESLEEAGIDYDDIESVLAIVLATEDDIVDPEA